jgi:drug/metabolite transporter (DMT)-like permease
LKASDVTDLIALAALWGGSFLFMRIAAGPFGPAPLIALRVGLAAVALLPLLAVRGELADLRRHARPIFVIGIMNSALPFCLFAYAVLSVSAGFAAILNATAPLFAALVAYLWIGEKLTPLRVAGLAVGFIGVIVLVWDKASFHPGGSGYAIAAGLAASLCYGISASYTKRRLNGVSPLAIATGSQVAAAIVLSPFAVLLRPAQWPAPGVWGSVLALAIGCTAVAYILYFRLIVHVGPSKAIAVTFLIPVFGMIWGAMFLDEVPTLSMLAGCAIILFGTALATGVVRVPLTGPARR